MMRDDPIDPTTHSNVFPTESIQGDGVLFKAPDVSLLKRPKAAPIVNIHKEYEGTKSYRKTRETIQGIITQHKSKALTNQEKYDRERNALKFKTNYIETSLATTGIPTVNDMAIVMERRRNHGDIDVNGTIEERIKRNIQLSYGSGKLDLKSLGIDEIPSILSSTFLLQMARFIKEIHINRNEFRNLSSTFCNGFRGCEILNASENNIILISNEIKYWKSLKILNLDYNQLNTIPNYLPEYLNTLKIAKNKINEINSIHRYHHLKILDLSSNQLITLPNGLNELKNLEIFQCSKNKLISAAILPRLSTIIHKKEIEIENNSDKNEKNWTISKDPLTGDEIYYNTITKQVTRTCPIVLIKKNIIPKLNLNKKKDFIEKKKIEFPGGWELTSHGIQTIYTNHNTGEIFSMIPKELDRFDSFLYMRTLNLSSNEIDQLPATIGFLYQLQVLELEHNRLGTLPDTLHQLRSLTTLHVGSNRLTKLPETITKIPMLKEFDVKFNRLIDLPFDIGNISSLTYFDASGNNLTTIPSSILDLKHLKTLNLIGNEKLLIPSQNSQKKGIISMFWEIKNQILIDKNGSTPQPNQVTSGIGDECVSSDIHVHKEFLKLIKDAENTHTIDFHWKNLTEIPFQLFQLKNLKELRLTGHVLERIPIEISLLVSLQILILRKNQLVEFPDDCIPENCPWEELDCQNNQLVLLPDTIRHCKRLRVLQMSCNTLEHIPSCIDELIALEFIYFSHNHLQTLPTTLSLNKKLTVLDISNNRIENLNSIDFGALENLIELRANCNLLFDLPISMNESNLIDISLSGNRFEEFPKMATKLKKIKRLWMQANKLNELPLEFGQLKTLEAVEFEGNPLRSPPPDILAQGIDAIHEYLQKRMNRVHEMENVLTSAQYGYHVDHFTPKTENLLHSGILFLLPEDLIHFDKSVDQYVNGPFYKYPHIKGIDLINELIDIQFKRSQASRLIVLEDLIELCQLIQSKRWLDKIEFRYDLTRPWGQDAYDVPVFMIDPRALYEDWEDVPGILKVIKKRVERGFHQETFNYTQQIVEDALNNYKGIYGPIGITTENVPFRCGCQELLRKKSQHNPCHRFGWIILQYIITPEEANRRQREEEHINNALSQLRCEIKSFCINSNDGKKRVLKEAKKLKFERKKRKKKINKQLYQLKKEKKKYLTNNNENKIISFFQNKKRKKKKQNEELFINEINQLNIQIHHLTELKNQIKNELKQNYTHYLDEIVEKLLIEAGAEIREKIQNNHRIKAIRKQYRRPWDGPNGLTFIQFKNQYLGLPPVEIPSDNSSISDVSGDFEDFANEYQDDSDDSIASEISSSEPSEEIKRDEKKNLQEIQNEAADKDDSDDSDI